MKHIWVVEVSSGKKWRPAGGTLVRACFSKLDAEATAKDYARYVPGLKWRVAKYERVGGDR